MGTIFSAGSTFMTRSRKALSRKGTRVSTPHANGALFARSTSHWCSRFSSRTVSLCNACGMELFSVAAVW